MRKCSLFFLLFAATLMGETTKPSGFISIKPTYFYPQDKVFRHLYHGGFLGLAELGVMINEKFFLSVERGYFYKKETVSSFDIDSASSVTVVPSSIYLGFVFAHGSFWDLYAKAGPNTVYASTHISIPNLSSHKHKWVFGGSFGCGSKLYFYRGCFAEIFLNYLYDKKQITDSGDHFSVYLGGLQTGGALGYQF